MARRRSTRRSVNVFGILRRTTRAVRGVGKFTRSTLKRGTNLLGITRKRRAHRRQH